MRGSDDQKIHLTMNIREIDIKEWQNAIVNDELFGSSVTAGPPASYNARYKDNVIVNLTFDFVLAIWDLSEELQERKKFALSNQLFRSGTAIGALVREAQNGESLADFSHKMKVALKEADEYGILASPQQRAEHRDSKGMPREADPDHPHTQQDHLLQ